MRRDQMEHILRAAAALTNERDFVVLGSQALLASFPDLPPPLNKSMELDLYPLANPAAADLIDGTIGELSPFDETFGYYGHGVAPETAVLPKGWRERAVIVENSNTGKARGICIGPHDLAIAKLAAGRDKDISFVRAMIQLGIVTTEALLPLTETLEEPHRSQVRNHLQQL
jgi:hypothetical protein